MFFLSIDPYLTLMYFIQLIKMYAWEHSFINILEIIRKYELDKLKSIITLNGLSVSLCRFSHVMVSILFLAMEDNI